MQNLVQVQEATTLSTPKLPSSQKTRMHFVILLTLLFQSWICVASAPARAESKFWSGSGSMELKTMMHEEVTREYYYYRPSGVSPSDKLPLVLAFHGGSATAKGFDKSCGGITKVADANKFSVVLPQGIDKHWNDSRPDMVKKNYDDVGLVKKIIESLQTQGLVDPKRVYAIGMSNGGFFSQYLAIKLPDKIAAVAAVVASVPQSFLNLVITRPLPVMMILGSADTLVPFKGGEIGGKLFPHKRGKVLPAGEAVEFWLEKNKNNAKPVATELPDKDKDDGCRVQMNTYGDSDDPNQFVYVEIKGGGHTYPQGLQWFYKKFIGPVCNDINANQLAWEFFSKHKLK